MLGKAKRLQQWVAGHEKNLCVLIYFLKYNFYLKCDGKPWKGFEIILVVWMRTIGLGYCGPVHSEGDWPWDFFGRNDAKAETPVLWPPHVKSWLIGKDSDVGRDWGQEEKRTTEDEMAGWHHWLDGRGSEWTPGVGDGQGGLACCDSWGRKESDTTEWLIWSDLIWLLVVGDHLRACGNVPGTNCRILVMKWILRKVDRMQDMLEAKRHTFLIDLKWEILF